MNLLLIPSILAIFLFATPNIASAEEIWPIGSGSTLKLTSDIEIRQPGDDSIPRLSVVRDGIRCILWDDGAPLKTVVEVVGAQKLRNVTYVDADSGSVLMLDDRLRIGCQAEKDMYTSVAITPKILQDFFNIEMITNTGKMKGLEGDKI